MVVYSHYLGQNKKNSCVPVSSLEKKYGRSVGTIFLFLNFIFIEMYQILHQNFIFIVKHSKIIFSVCMTIMIPLGSLSDTGGLSPCRQSRSFMSAVTNRQTGP